MCRREYSDEGLGPCLLMTTLLGALALYQLYFTVGIFVVSYLLHHFDEDSAMVFAYLVAKLIFFLASFIALVAGWRDARRELDEKLLSFGYLIVYRDRLVFGVYFAVYLALAVMGSYVAFGVGDTGSGGFVWGTTIADYVFLSLFLGFSVYIRGLLRKKN